LRRLHVAQIHDFLNTGGRHKSQGSEYPAVIIPVLIQHYAMLQRNLLYTGVTRRKRLVVLVGQEKAIAIAKEERRPREGADNGADCVAAANQWPTALST
jgi:hypothetical protein